MNEELASLLQRPLQLSPTRVWRTYEGGKLIDELQDCENPKDSHFPENWIASLVQARNLGREDTIEGLSFLENNGCNKKTLKEVIESDPEAFLGEKHVKRYGSDTGVLVKILDSLERLTIQVHPDRETAKRLFNSSYGKTEAWYIIGGRETDNEKPYILLGFKPGVTREDWEEMFREQDIGGMQEALHKFHVQPGDVFLIEGGVPHAIGPGCFLVEIQEPTDYTIRVERRTPKGLEVPDELCHQGIGFDKMFECFRYDGLTRDETQNKYQLKPVVKRSSRSGAEFSLINYTQTDKFAMDMIEVNSEMEFERKESFSVLLVISGQGELCLGSEQTGIKRGDNFFMPYGVKDFKLINKRKETLKIIRCFPLKI